MVVRVDVDGANEMTSQGLVAVQTSGVLAMATWSLAWFVLCGQAEIEGDGWTWRTRKLEDVGALMLLEVGGGTCEFEEEMCVGRGKELELCLLLLMKLRCMMGSGFEMSCVG